MRGNFIKDNCKICKKEFYKRGKAGRCHTYKGGISIYNKIRPFGCYTCSRKCSKALLEIHKKYVGVSNENK